MKFEKKITKEVVIRYLCLENNQKDNQDENENNNQENVEEKEDNNQEDDQNNQSNEENQEPLPEEQQRRAETNIWQAVRYQDYYTEADREYEEGGEALLTYVEVMQLPHKNL